MRFSLGGKISGIENGTIIYLDKESEGKTIDSVVVQNNLFNFKTKLTESPLRVILRTKDNSLYKQIWLENKPITLDATSDDFNNALITGSSSEISYNSLYKAVDTLSRKASENLLMKFITENSNNALGAYVLSEWNISWKKEKTEPLYNGLSSTSKNSIYGKKVRKYLELYYNPKIGEAYADLNLADQYGKYIRLSDMKGKLILLDFWAEWCGPCRKDNKQLVDIYEKYKFLGFEIYQVSLDNDKQKWIKAMRKDKISWTNVSDLKGWKSDAASIYGVNLLPTKYLINQEGIIIDKNFNIETLELKLKEL